MAGERKSRTPHWGEAKNHSQVERAFMDNYSRINSRKDKTDDEIFEERMQEIESVGGKLEDDIPIADTPIERGDNQKSPLVVPPSSDEVKQETPDATSTPQANEEENPNVVSPTNADGVTPTETPEVVTPTETPEVVTPTETPEVEKDDEKKNSEVLKNVKEVRYEWGGVPEQAYSESRALQLMEKMPFVDALKAAGIEKPDPKVLENAKRRQKYRANAATLAETLRVLSDIGSASAGGNVYARDNKDVEKANAEYEKEESKYDNKTNEYQKLLLQGLLNDRNSRLQLLADIDKLGKHTITEATPTEDKKPIVQKPPKAEKDPNAGNRYITVRVPNQDGSIQTKKIHIRGGDAGWQSYLTNASRTILESPAMIKSLAEKYSMTEEDVRDILLNGIIVSGENGERTRNATQQRTQFIVDMALANQEMADLLDAGIVLPPQVSRPQDASVDPNRFLVGAVRQAAEGSQPAQAKAEKPARVEAEKPAQAEAEKAKQPKSKTKGEIGV
jgi:hypothetical protein